MATTPASQLRVDALTIAEKLQQARNLVGEATRLAQEKAQEPLPLDRYEHEVSRMFDDLGGGVIGDNRNDLSIDQADEIAFDILALIDLAIAPRETVAA